MTITTPTQLVDEFKKSGKFDRLRRELLSQFHRSDTTGSFTSRVEDIARQRLLSDHKLQYMAPDAAHKELMKEMDRYPIVERAVEELQMLSDPSFAAGVQSSIQKILREDREKSAPPLNIDKPNPASALSSQPTNGTIFRALSPPSAMAEVAVSTISKNSDLGLGSQSHDSTTDILIPIIQMSGENGAITVANSTDNPRASSHLVEPRSADDSGGGPKFPNSNLSDRIDSR